MHIWWFGHVLESFWTPSSNGKYQRSPCVIFCSGLWLLDAVLGCFVGLIPLLSSSVSSTLLKCYQWRKWGTHGEAKEMVDSHTASYNVQQLEFKSRDSGPRVSELTTIVPPSGPTSLLTSGSWHTVCLSEFLHLTQSSSYIPTFLNLAFILKKKKLFWC